MKPTVAMIVIGVLMIFGFASILQNGLLTVHERVVKLADLPNTRRFRDDAGRAFDAGGRYETLGLSGLGLYTRNHRWCAYISDDDCAPVADRAFFVERAKPNTSRIPETITPKFWDAYGAWAFFAGIFAAAALRLRFDKTASPQEPRPAPSAADPWS